MKKLLKTAILFLGLSGLASQSFSSPAGDPHFKKVVWVVFENANYQAALKQPDFNQMSQYGALFTNMMAETHPSQGNYIAMIAGSILGVKNDKPVDLDGKHVGDLLEKAGMSWRVYAEGYPGNCFKGESTGGYYRKHVPFMSFKNVTGDAKRCQNIESNRQFDQDLANGKLPEFSMYIPDIKDDGHDSGVNYAGRWLASKFGSLLNQPDQLKDVLFILTFDESGSSPKNQIYTVLIGSHVKPGSQNSQSVDHVSLLRMIEDELQIGQLGRDDLKATKIDGIWR